MFHTMAPRYVVASAAITALAVLPTKPATQSPDLTYKDNAPAHLRVRWRNWFQVIDILPFWYMVMIAVLLSSTDALGFSKLSAKFNLAPRKIRKSQLDKIT